MLVCSLLIFIRMRQRSCWRTSVRLKYKAEPYYQVEASALTVPWM